MNEACSSHLLSFLLSFLGPTLNYSAQGTKNYLFMLCLQRKSHPSETQLSRAAAPLTGSIQPV